MEWGFSAQLDQLVKRLLGLGRITYQGGEGDLGLLEVGGGIHRLHPAAHRRRATC